MGARDGRSPAESRHCVDAQHPAVTAAIVGARRPDQLDGIVGAADVQLTDADLQQIG